MTNYLQNYGDEALADLLNQVLAEQERRARIARVPAQIAAMATQFVADGGDKTKIEEALAPIEVSVPLDAEAPVIPEVS